MRRLSGLLVIALLAHLTMEQAAPCAYRHTGAAAAKATRMSEHTATAHAMTDRDGSTHAAPTVPDDHGTPHGVPRDCSMPSAPCATTCCIAVVIVTASSGPGQASLARLAADDRAPTNPTASPDTPPPRV